MLADLEALVRCESYSADHAALARSAEAVGALGTRLLGAAPESIVIDGATHLRWVFGTPRVLLVGHHDTVWPTGSLEARPWSVTAGIARGPGVLDMKAGLVQMFHALASLRTLDGVCVLVNGDEEIGSPTSRELIEEAARGSAAAFVLEASGDRDGALKTARKGSSRYEVTVHGRAAHAGLDPEKGVNAAVEAAHQVLAIAGIGAAVAGGSGAIRVSGDSAATGGGAGTSTVTPTLLSAGSTPNTVPARARIAVDVRVPTSAAQDHIDTLLRGLTPRTPGARLEIRGIGGRPPMEPGASAELFALASRIARELGQSPLRGIAVGGVSDGNCTAAVGCPTLDGLGAVGAGAHADDEYVEVASMIPRSRLLAELVTRTLR
ncbi:M20 family metallopeptidase [Streptomyces microflavus]|uniref:Glutamate carboxypeptidase n=1 Tax=Streptomyces microflavus TaxID=1919 RepID=A0A7J0CNW5_STRMI|nr:MULTISPECIES: M20 family metallopeptidase [Streptomyces]MDX2977285.1 M20 family metallopeptidase [Streptomyces sp. NRRL_B-2249]GFN04183.1 glutamate carboxypeptidase [Streptomyces microflavus]GGX42485.1 glutamate carboxypeptidase [Streptomyces microflavus]